MLTSKDCLAKYGPPENESGMVVFDVPTYLELGVVPKKIYCNRDMVEPLQHALSNIVSRGFIHLLKTWDGCFNIRSKRGASSPSLHSWGVAVDINAAWNRFGQPPTMSSDLVRCFTDAGFDWGGTWNKPDGMHFQLKELP